MPAPKSYRPWSPHQPYLLPPSPGDWLPRDHLAYFVLDLVHELDLSAIEDAIGERDPRGVRPYDPRFLVALLLYGYAAGVVSSRKLVRATFEDVGLRVISGGEHPHFTTICDFRRTHLEALEGLFVQVLRLCQEAGLVELGHVSIDGTKMQANASKHRAMSYDRMLSERTRLEREVRELLRRAEEADAAEDARYGVGKDGYDLPEELRHRESRLEKIRQAKARLEEEARASRARDLREQAEGHQRTAEEHADPVVRKRAETRRKKSEAAAEELEDDNPQGSLFFESEPTETPLPHHKVAATPEGLPRARAQMNFTDPDSRIMEYQGGFIQGYNGQIAVDAANQIIVAQALTNQAPDNQHLIPLLERVERDCGVPTRVTADTGYWSRTGADVCQKKGIDAYIAVGRLKHGWVRATPPAEGPAPEEASARERMRHKLQTPLGRETYRLRKCIPEPVFGQIKAARGLRQFLHRGLRKVRWEWAMYCTGHNLLKLFASRRRVAGT